MRNPFPGMNPYLEESWGDVHVDLCGRIRAALQPHLPSGLRARAQVAVLVRTAKGQRPRAIEPDGVVIESAGSTSHGGATGAVATVKPVLIRHAPRVIRERWVEILDTKRGDRVVTAIEILSPGNKLAGLLNKRYRRKLASYMQAGVNIVEIDLLRSSRKRLEIRTDELPPERRAAYLVSIHRAAGEEGEWEVYPMPLREPLPVIPVPCRETDPDVPLALQPLIGGVYSDGGYDDIDYSRPLRPRLSEDDARWVAAITAAK